MFGPSIAILSSCPNQISPLRKFAARRNLSSCDDSSKGSDDSSKGRQRFHNKYRDWGSDESRRSFSNLESLAGDYEQNQSKNSENLTTATDMFQQATYTTSWGYFVDTIEE